MKILFIQDSLGTGGAERSNADFWYFLREQGIELKVIVLEHRSVGIENEILNAGFNVTFLKGKNFLGHVFQISRIIKKEKPDVVHSVLFKASIRTRICNWLRPFNHIEHLVSCPYSKARFSDPLVNKFILKIYKRIDSITQSSTKKFIAITEEVKLHYINELGIASNRIEVVLRGRKRNEFLSNKKEVSAEYRKSLGIKDNSIVIIHAGRQEFAKGHLIILKSIKILESKGYQDLVFLMCGRDGNSTPAIKEYINVNNLYSDIKWLGHRSDLVKLLLCADIFVFPSLFEGLGGVLIEAQAAALPIVCSDIKVFNEVVNSKNSLRFESNNENDLAENLIKIINDDQKRISMSKESLSNYDKLFNLDLINNKLLYHFSNY